MLVVLFGYSVLSPVAPRSRQNKHIKTKFSLNYAFGMEAVQIHLLPAQWPSSTSCKGIIIIPLLFFFSFTGLSCVCEWANLFHSFFMLCPLAEKKTLVEKFRDQRKKERKNSMNGKTHCMDVWNFPPKRTPSGVIYKPMKKKLKNQETLNLWTGLIRHWQGLALTA